MRINFHVPAIILSAALCLLADPGRAAQTTAPAPSKVKLTYTPAANADLARTRILGTLRSGTTIKPPFLSVVAPEHAGTTLVAQPQLYWYISQATELPVEISVIEEGSEDRLYGFQMKGTTAGFHCLDLAKEGTHLDVNKRYQFVVSLVINAQNRAKDLVTSGDVKRLKAPDEIANSKADGIDRTKLLLDSGIWYDGVADLMKQIDTNKDNADLTAARDVLFKQVGLDDIISKPAAPVAQTRP